jgi:hypothetical protein
VAGVRVVVIGFPEGGGARRPPDARPPAGRDHLRRARLPARRHRPVAGHRRVRERPAPGARRRVPRREPKRWPATGGPRSCTPATSCPARTGSGAKSSGSTTAPWPTAHEPPCDAATTRRRRRAAPASSDTEGACADRGKNATHPRPRPPTASSPKRSAANAGSRNRRYREPAAPAAPRHRGRATPSPRDHPGLAGEPPRRRSVTPGSALPETPAVVRGNLSAPIPGRRTDPGFDRAGRSQAPVVEQVRRAGSASRLSPRRGPR